VAGGKIPEGITENRFRVPRNRLIFRALRELGGFDITGIGALTVFLRETGRLEEAGGEAYLAEIENMIGIPSAVRGFALGLLRLHLGDRHG
jgi:hypothetical protein